MAFGEGASVFDDQEDGHMHFSFPQGVLSRANISNERSRGIVVTFYNLFSLFLLQFLLFYFVVPMLNQDI